MTVKCAGNGGMPDGAEGACAAEARQQKKTAIKRWAAKILIRQEADDCIKFSILYVQVVSSSRDTIYIITNI